MSERLTWKEIKEKYPKQYVYLSDVEWAPDNDTTIQSAVVSYAANDHDEEYLLRTVEGEFTERYTAYGANALLDTGADIPVCYYPGVLTQHFHAKKTG